MLDMLLCSSYGDDGWSQDIISPSVSFWRKELFISLSLVNSAYSPDYIPLRVTILCTFYPHLSSLSDGT